MENTNQIQIFLLNQRTEPSLYTCKIGKKNTSDHKLSLLSKLLLYLNHLVTLCYLSGPHIISTIINETFLLIEVPLNQS